MPSYCHAPDIEPASTAASVAAQKFPCKLRCEHRADRGQQPRARDSHMNNKLGATNGALSIMVGAGTIADYEVVEADNKTLVRIWPADRRDDARLRKQVAALLPDDVEERHVVVVE